MKDPIELRGIGKKYRRLLGKVIQLSNGFMTVSIVSKALEIPPSLSKLYLSRWAKSGWIKRIKRGFYIPVEIQTTDLELVMEDPWVIGNGLFSDCYIGGWTAAHHWGFTDQLYNDVLILSNQRPSATQQKVGHTTFIIKKVAGSKMFGLKTIWRENSKVKISDPHKTIIDTLDDPSTAGGIRSSLDFLYQYLRSSHKNLGLLVEYAKKMKNKTIFKRLGYLLSLLGEKDDSILKICKENMSKGYSQLDPAIKGRILIKKWNLWIPSHLTFDGELYDSQR